jgi:hypothetical protein
MIHTSECCPRNVIVRPADKYHAPVCIYTPGTNVLLPVASINVKSLVLSKSCNRLYAKWTVSSTWMSREVGRLSTLIDMVPETEAPSPVVSAEHWWILPLTTEDAPSVMADFACRAPVRIPRAPIVIAA